MNQQKSKEDDKADEGIDVENLVMSEDSCSVEEESPKPKTADLVPSISITRVSPKKSPEKQLSIVSTESVKMATSVDLIQTSNESSDSNPQIITKQEHDTKTDNYIISDDIAEENNDDNIVEDIEDESISVKNENSLNNPFSSPFQPMISQQSQYSQYFPSPTANPYNFPSRGALPPSPPFSNPLVSMSNLAAMYQ